MLPRPKLGTMAGRGAMEVVDAGALVVGRNLGTRQAAELCVMCATLEAWERVGHHNRSLAATDYLKGCVGEALSEGLAKVTKSQPFDAVDFLGAYLIRYADNQEAKAKRKLENEKRREVLREARVAARAEKKRLEVRCVDTTNHKSQPPPPAPRGGGRVTRPTVRQPHTRMPVA